MSDEIVDAEYRIVAAGPTPPDAPDGAIVPLQYTGHPIDRHPALRYLDNLSEGSRRTMRQSLDVVAEIASGGQCDHVTFPWGALRYEHTSAIRARLMDRYDSAATINKIMSAMRQVITEAWRFGYMTAEEKERAIDFKPAKGVGLKQAEAGRKVNKAEMVRMIRACEADEHIAGLRDSAMLRLYWFTGLRRSEMAGIRMQDINWDDMILVIKGKGNKVRTLPLTDPGTINALRRWISAAKIMEGDAPLFPGITKGGRIKKRRNGSIKGITDNGVYYILEKRRKEAGVRPFTPHDLRRTFAGELLDAGADLATVQRLMGHSNSDTTAGYDRRGEYARRDALSRMKLDVDEEERV